MRHTTIGLCLSLLACVCYGQASDEPINEETAKTIALATAGCAESDHCVANGSFRNGKWTVVVLRPHPGDRANPAELVAVILDARGHVLKRLPNKK